MGTLQWLNNCVGHKNYISFVLLMAFSLIWVSANRNILFFRLQKQMFFYIYDGSLLRNLMRQLLIECGVGITVMVRCFANRRGIETEIVDRLGDGFSQPPFATVVVCSSCCHGLSF